MNYREFRIGFLPVMADLYNRLVPELREKLGDFTQQLKLDLQNETLEFITAPVSCTENEIRTACEKLERQQVDLLVLGMVSYTPSGQILPALLATKLPLIVWPAQPMLELFPEKYDFNVVLMNHGMHGAQDLANMLRRKGRAHGMLHGHHKQNELPKELFEWARAGKLLQSMRLCNPCFIGGHFEDMLDLQLENEKFIAELDVVPKEIDIEQFIQVAKNKLQQQIKDKMCDYRERYIIDASLSGSLLAKAARHELALRELLEQYDSTAVGINFMSLCNNTEIADALHLAACSLMADGIGYAGEGDWVTAMLLRGMFSAGYIASFSEQFSVGYKDNRLVLRHWGEGNPQLARSKPLLKASTFSDQQKADFVVMDFEFRPGLVTLINLNTTVEGNGQIVSIPGSTEETHLPAVDGPRAVFKPMAADVRELLDCYAAAGGSHHMVLVVGDCTDMLKKTAKLTGWSYLNLEQACREQATI